MKNENDVKIFTDMYGLKMKKDIEIDLILDIPLITLNANGIKHSNKYIKTSKLTLCLLQETI